MLNKKNKNKFYSTLWFLSWALLAISFLFKHILINTESHIKNDYLFIASTVILIINLILYTKIINNNWTYKKIFTVLTILSTYLLIFLPISSTDVYAYIYEGRIWSIHHLNPYIQTYKELKNDEFYKILGKHPWANTTSLYGPLFTIFSFMVTAIGKSSLFFSLYLFKIFSTLAHLTNSLLIYKLTNNKKILLLFAFNPLFLFEFIVNGHNDVFMISFLLLSFYFLLNKSFSLKNNLLSIFFLILSGLIKYFSFLLLPIFLLVIIKNTKNKKRSYTFALSSIIMSLGIIALSYLPFLDSLDVIVKRILSKNSVIEAPISSLIMGVSLTLNSIQGMPSYEKIIIYINRLIFFLSYLGILIHIIINKITDYKKSIINYSFIAITLFYLFFFTWLAPWYYTLLITILILKYYYHREYIYLYFNYFIIFYAIISYLRLR